MDRLAKKLISRIIKYSKLYPGKIGKVELKIREIILRSRMSPGIHYAVEMNQEDGRNIEFSAGIFCKSSHKDKYGRADNIALDVCDYFTAIGTPVEITEKNLFSLT